MSRGRISWTLALTVLAIVTTARVAAHPMSTFGVRLNVTGSRVKVTINADIEPLLLKLDALDSARQGHGDVVARIEGHADLIREMSAVEAGMKPVLLTLTGVSINQDKQVDIVLTGAIPDGASTMTWQSRLIYGAYPLSVSHGADAVESVFWLEGLEESPALAAQVSVESAATFTGYAGLGFVHILPRGLDHILFVLGVFLLTPRLRSLLAQVSVFTLAHSISLGLAIWGVISVPAAIVEPLIALSIAYVGVENLFQRTLSSRRLWLVGAFGLLHGLGFAGVLSAVSLPAAQWLPALLGFNVGVELGQVTVLVLAAAISYPAARSVNDSDRWIRKPASAVIAMMGLFWVVTRL